MLSWKTPVYRDGKSRFTIDSCAAKRAALQKGKIELHALTKGHYPGILLPTSQLPGISNIGFWNSPNMQDWGTEEHRNEGIEICYLETGLMHFQLEGRVFEVHAGDVRMTAPWQLHRLGAPNIGPGRHHWVILDVGVRGPGQKWRWPGWVTLTSQDREELTRLLQRNERPVWKATAQITSAFSGLGESVLRWKESHTESRMMALLNQLLVGVLMGLTEQQPRQEGSLNSHRRAVELFLKDLAANSARSKELWTLETMAEKCGIGTTALLKYCHELVNDSPVDYLNQCRLEHSARELLESPERSVTEIAVENGFGSSQYFATVFHRHFRMTPRDYRRQAP